MTVSSIIEGLQLIQDGKPKKESDYHFRAEHDEIFVGSLAWKVDRDRLKKLGWIEDKDIDGWRALV